MYVHLFSYFLLEFRVGVENLQSRENCQRMGVGGPDGIIRKSGGEFL